MTSSFPLLNSIMLACLVGLAALVSAPPTAAAADAGFALQDKPGQYLDVLLDGRTVARYMYAYDNSSKDKLALTYKPYLHEFDAEGRAPITKGPGGASGLFRGYNFTQASKAVRNSGRKRRSNSCASL